jgi:hypothetical protein
MFTPSANLQRFDERSQVESGFSSRDASEKVVNKPLLNRSEQFLLAIT